MEHLNGLLETLCGLLIFRWAGELQLESIDTGGCGHASGAIVGGKFDPALNRCIGLARTGKTSASDSTGLIEYDSEIVLEERSQPAGRV